MIPDHVEKARPIRWIDILKYLKLAAVGRYEVTARDVEAYLNPMSDEASNARTRLFELAQAGLVTVGTPDSKKRHATYSLTQQGYALLQLAAPVQDGVLKALRRSRRQLEKRRRKHLAVVKQDWHDTICRATQDEVNKAMELLK